jgi:hypothetical protein
MARPEITGKKPETMSIPEAGKHYYNLGRNGSYEAANRGDLITISVGRLRRVVVRAMERKLDRVGESNNA